MSVAGYLAYFVGLIGLSFSIGWLSGELIRGPQPRWFEVTRYTLAQLTGRERQYWRAHDIAKYGCDRLSEIERRLR